MKILTGIIMLTVFVVASSLPAAAAPACPVLQDGGFESSVEPSFPDMNPFWTEFSTNYETPLCTANFCGPDGSRTGSWWAWLGGSVSVPETASVEQSVVLTAGTTPRLEFYLNITESSGNGTDLLRVLVDGTEILSILEGDNLFVTDPPTGYMLVGIDLTAFATGSSRKLTFESTTAVTPLTSFMLDDVSLSCDPGSVPAVKTGPLLAISSDGATLSGTVNANGADTTAVFVYGTTPAYGSSSDASQSPVSGSLDSPVDVDISGLSPLTTYHYRLRGENATGIGYGYNGTFTTHCLGAGSAAQVLSTSDRYDTITEAMTAVADSDDTIKTPGATFLESLTFAGAGIVTLDGGYACDLITPSSKLTSVSQITVAGSGTLIASSITIQ